MRMPTEEERMIRCLLADIHEPLDLLFPGLRTKAHMDPQAEELSIRIDYDHAKLGRMGFCHAVSLYQLTIWGREGMVRYLMQEIPRRVLEGLLVKAQQYSQSNWYSK
ncbi:hypothetical protein FBPa25_0024 [Pseudomonas phage vB_PaeP_FBPa25]|uniref:Uncharacterized protein n=8 Tax=Viruses TaxID=10239 RepID=A0A9E7U0D4_9CAUD|nr:hypothetical protein V417_gp20 [Pseudomonas phage MPK6]QYW08422.1 hypothetical protein vBPaeQDWS_22 [Pseudomonas phage vB_Pae_QDWS]QZI94237.1 hypothetical protein phage551_00023 [Pseudomonas phage vB_PaeA_55_1W]UKH48732.1 hypothetical protein [Pseudomonas phage L5]UVN13053.1 hypothetical protein FBPa3_0023 [Pseudomonas phage vB_PaeM_FBPa3]UVN13174.1 hypothetical protein FBPa6_0020 [Pseudomonas phage vB_PaeP_FBPa6]UVN13558.1 hypothetical protein FBPa18_0029 [Pseudomonas phage vB_PaeP_FBPa18